MQLTATRMEKQSTGSIPWSLSPGVVKGVSINRSREVELWALLDYIYNIDSAREEHLLRQGITNAGTRARVGLAFKSYLTQANNFYTYASNSDYRSAGLLYYYSFLNLAKAKLVVSDPTLLGKKFHHGMRRVHLQGDIAALSTAANATSGNRVSTFNELYKLWFGQYLPVSHSLTIENALSYSSDIDAEFEKVTNKRAKLSPVKYIINIDTNRRKCWVKLAIYDWGRHSVYQSAFNDFRNAFHRVSLYPLTADSQFQIPPASMSWYSFFESNDEFDFIGTDSVDTFSCDDLVRRVLKDRWQSELYNARDFGFDILSPTRATSNLGMNELFSTYLNMFHLSEIVRYSPDMMERLLSSNTKSGWLLKHCIDQAPLTFLYRMTCWITGVDWRLSPR